MKILIILIWCSILTNATHPFVGDNAHLDTVQRDDGSLAVKLTQKSAPITSFNSKCQLCFTEIYFRILKQNDLIRAVSIRREYNQRIHIWS